MFPVGERALRVMFDTVLPVCTIETTDAYYRGLKIQNRDWQKARRKRYLEDIPFRMCAQRRALANGGRLLQPLR